MADEKVGMGKTSLIKSIVQLCEDIVHVDPLSSNIPPLGIVSVGRAKDKTKMEGPSTTEVYASTKPYPWV